jgi:hypothetical protein
MEMDPKTGSDAEQHDFAHDTAAPDPLQLSSRSLRVWRCRVARPGQLEVVSVNTCEAGALIPPIYPD